MRCNAEVNIILDQTLITCTQIKVADVIHKGKTERIRSMCERIPNKVAAKFLFFGLELVEYGYVPEYIDVVLNCEFEQIKAEGITREELRVLVILKSIITRWFQEDDYDFFIQFCSHECRAEIRNLIFSILNPWISSRK